MMMRMYAIKDKLGTYTQPMHYPNDDTAIRHISLMRKEDKLMQFAPDDFEMFYIGMYNSETAEYINGEITPIERIRTNENNPEISNSL